MVRLDAVRVDVAARLVTIALDERDALLRKLRVVAGFDGVIAQFEEAGTYKPVELDSDQRLRLRVALQVWKSARDLSDGLARLLAALAWAERAGHGSGVGPPRMEESGLDRVRVNVAGDVVEIAWSERDWLLKKINAVAGYETIVEKFEAVGASTPVKLDRGERTRLRVPLEFWEQTRDLPEGGLARLLAALIRADPGASSTVVGSP